MLKKTVVSNVFLEFSRTIIMHAFFTVLARVQFPVLIVKSVHQNLTGELLICPLCTLPAFSKFVPKQIRNQRSTHNPSHFPFSSNIDLSTRTFVLCLCARGLAVIAPLIESLDIYSVCSSTLLVWLGEISPFTTLTWQIRNVLTLLQIK